MVKKVCSWNIVLTDGPLSQVKNVQICGGICEEIINYDYSDD